MVSIKWIGVGDYDELIALSEEEMREFADHFNIDWSFFTNGTPNKKLGDHYYCFVNYSRKVLALLPFLALAFGGQYNDEPPFEGEPRTIEIDYDDYSLEEFSWPR